MYTRLGAVGELRARLASADPGVALGAREALRGRRPLRHLLRRRRGPGRPRSQPVRGSAHRRTGAGGRFSANCRFSAGERGEPLGMPTAQEGSPPASAAEPAQPTMSAGPDMPAEATQPTMSAGPDMPTEAAPPTKATEPAEALRRTEPVQAEDSPSTRHRVPAGRTMLTGGSLMLVSAILPDFVYGESAFGFRPQLAVVLLCVGAVSASLAAAILLAPQLRDRWRWPVTVMAVAAVVTLVLVLDAFTGLSAGDVDLGIWVALAGCLTTLAAGVVALAARRKVHAGASRPAEPASCEPAGTSARPRSTPRVRGGHRGDVRPTFRRERPGHRPE